MALVNSILGEDAVLKYSGLIASFPGSTNQPWHGDGPHLFGRKMQCPIHAVNLFIPLTDISDELGPTEFLPESHLLSNAMEADAQIKYSNKNTAGSIKPLLKRGDLLFYDYRLVHRGTGNKHPNQTRLMFYMLYTKPWFNENINFGENSIFSENAFDHKTKIGENPECAGYVNI